MAAPRSAKHIPRDDKAVISYCVRRNFTSCGLSKVDAVQMFHSVLFTKAESKRLLQEQESFTMGQLRDNLKHVDDEIGSTPVRYPLLVARKGFAALNILEEYGVLGCDGQKEVETIFGSSFAEDHEYTSVCRAINHVKLCLESGKVAVLINLQHIYESIYDALNQYYTYFGGNKYVDLGLGTQRVKCRVHRDARLVIVATREEIVRDFPVPLINRLEKHEVSVALALKDDGERKIAEELKAWAIRFNDTVTATTESLAKKALVAKTRTHGSAKRGGGAGMALNLDDEDDLDLDDDEPDAYEQRKQA